MMSPIFQMQLSDLKSVLKIEKLSFSTSWTFNAFIYELLVNDKASYFTYKLENQVIGYIGYWILEDDLHITNLAVAPLFRKKGIATKLTKYAIQRARRLKISRVSLEVRVSNKNAIQLYEKLGFEKGELLKGYYKIEDGLEMFLLIEGGNNGKK